jgi:hypothetical protein
MATMRKFEVMFDETYTVGIRGRAIFTQKYVIKLRN